MFRIQLVRFFLLGAALFATGCISSGDRPRLFGSNGCGCNSCGSSQQPGLIARMRAPSTPAPVVVSGDCAGCGSGTLVSGPYLPPMQPGTIVSPAPGTPSTVPPPMAPPNTIPPINDNAKQLPYDPKMARPGTTTSADNSTKSSN